MAARLRRRESGTEGVRRLVRRDLDGALGHLRAGRRAGDGSVHEARKQLKRARAALRLVRPALGDRVYARENRALRDAARPLSALRDARILLDTLAEVVKSVAPRDRAALRKLAPKLETHLEDVRRRKGSLVAVTEKLRSARRRSKKWRMDERGWSILGRGLRRTYRAGRRAFTTVSRDPTAENLHEWRKQTKYLWHELQFLEPARPRALRTLADRAHRLSDRLGKDHDLVVFRPYLPRQDLATHVDRLRQGLRTEALALGAKLYADKPRRFAERIEQCWRTWRDA